MKVKICAIGDAGIDQYLDYGLSKPGGCSLNFSCHYRMVSPHSPITLLSAIGARSNNRPVFDCLEHYELRSELQYLDGISSTQPIRLHTNGEKIFFNYDPGVLKDFVLNEVQIKILQSSDVLVFSFFLGNERLMSQVFQNRTTQKIIIDFGSLVDFNKKIEPVLPLLEKLDIAFFGLSAQDEVLIGELKALSKKLNKLIIVTLGEKGSVAFEKGSELISNVDNPVKMVDSTGAGDSFAAAFLGYHLNGYPLPDSLRFANAHAAKTVTYLGAIPM